MGLTGDKGMKAPVDLATTGNVTLSGEQTVDGVLTSVSRVLVWQNTDQTQNGIYDTSSAAWTRAIDCNGYQDLVKGTLVAVTRGAQAGYYFHCTSSNPITFGTSAITFAQDLTNTTSALTAALANSGSSATGTGLLGWIRAATSAVATTLYRWLDWQDINVFEFMTIAQIADVQARTALLDVGAACRAAVAAAIAAGKKRVNMPAGSYLIGSTAGADTLDNGILFPFSSVNPDPSSSVMLCGAGPSTVLLCGSNSMILVRVARNNVTLKDLTLDGNGKTAAWGVGIVPESMTQTATQVSQQYITLDNVGRQNFTEGLVIQPGPQVAASDSGCFYINVFGGYSNLNTRHVYTKKNTDWASHPNRPTRVNFFGQQCLRGNTGYYFEVGSEIELHGCYEELIATGTSPLATPTARYVSADCTNLRWFGGTSEACTAGTNIAATGILAAFGYVHVSGSDATFIANASSYDDAVNDSRVWTPVLTSTGGGAQGAVTSTGRVTKLGKIAYFTCQVSAAKGTLSAGTLSVSGLPYVADTNWTGASIQGVPVTNWSGITFTANVFTMAARISGSTIELRKQHAAGAGPAGLTLAECADPVVFEVQGFYKTA